MDSRGRVDGGTGVRRRINTRWKLRSERRRNGSCPAATRFGQPICPYADTLDGRHRASSTSARIWIDRLTHSGSQLRRGDFGRESPLRIFHASMTKL